MSIRELPDDLKTVAKNELGDGESRILDDIRYIEEWLSKQPHINARTDPQWLAAFIRGCKYSRERTKEKIDAYYTIRTHLPELFADRDPRNPKINDVLDLGLYLPLPATSSGVRVILVRGAIYDPAEYNFLEIMRCSFMIMDVMLLEDDRTSIVGQDTMLDLEGSRIEHVAQFTPAVVKKVITCFQDGYPIRTKSLNYVNPPKGFEMVFNIFKSFMKEKLKQRIAIHTDMESLYKRVPKNILPSDYGGDGPSVAELTAEWKQKVVDKRDWFLEDLQFRVDESKRPGKPVSGAELFGVDGSFKQLSID